nr:T9SS type A sorting domain-containing protein [Chitinophagaceae bacterium]
MNIKRTLLSMLAVVTLQNIANAQSEPCGVLHAHQAVLEKYPELKAQIAQADTYLNGLDVKNLEKNRAGNYIIPVVFHVIHNYGAENISDAQIYDEMKTLNKYFQKKNADTSGIIPVFKPLIANVGIEFRLANKDPEGNCTNGIDRIHNYKTNGANDQSKLNPWNRSVYYNIWVINDLVGDQNVLAYAYKPATAQNLFFYDGVIVKSNCVGTIGTGQAFLGRTLTHETGHVLNLDHTWGGTNQPKVACGDDGVLDTPQTKGHDNCGNLYDSTCNAPVIENVQNVMDYSFCTAQMFTLGQKDRMLSALTSPIAQRSSLYSPQSLAFAGVDGPVQDCAPKADFNVNRQFTCKGTSVNFTNKSFNDTTMTASLWDFTADGTPATSTTLASASASFATVGWKNITLQATSNAGSGTTVKNNYIFVADPIGKVVTGQINSFEDETAFNTNWANFNYYHNNFKWEHYPWGGYSGTKCIRYHAFDDRPFPQSTIGSAKGDVDELITEAYDLTGLSVNNAYLNFLLAGATRASINADMDDSLVIQYSINCGASWVNLVKLSKTGIINNGTIAAEFDPSFATAVWAPKSFALPQAALTNSTFFKLRYRPGDLSNNVYLDNFEINSTPVSVKNVNATGFEFEIVPNPANNFANIQINTASTNQVHVLITNLMGAKVAAFTQKVNSGSINTLEIPADVFTQKGIYFVNIEMDGKKATKKLVIQ